MWQRSMQHFRNSAGSSSCRCADDMSHRRRRPSCGSIWTHVSVRSGCSLTRRSRISWTSSSSARLIWCSFVVRRTTTTSRCFAARTESDGMKSYFCQNEYGQIAPVYSISAGLDYPGIGPEHAYLHDIGRAQYVPVTDDEAVNAFEYMSKMEGIIPAIESSHAVAYALKLAPTMRKDQTIVITISGRGGRGRRGSDRARYSVFGSDGGRASHHGGR